MAKHLFEHMNEEKRKPDMAGSVSPDACMFNQEELNEFTIYDCNSRLRKRELVLNKVRKAYVGESIVVKLMMKNPLMESMMSNPQFMRSIMQSNPRKTFLDFTQLLYI